MDIPLDIHQGTVSELAGDITASMFKSNEINEGIQTDLPNKVDTDDGTNACAFLSMKIELPPNFFDLCSCRTPSLPSPSK
ncbi:hypothetical protein AC249_AIPGENE21486 [Exaiptasia diaphana]|nr:hypothetical protein AC249_AIPGENE21486 [Exaiptasia diaphana]